MKRSSVTWALIITLGLGIGGSRAQETDPLVLRENYLIAVQSRLDSLRLEYTRYFNRADMLAHEIDLAKTKNKLSPGDHRRLERLLQQSQQLESKVQKTRNKMADVSSQYQEVLEEIIGLYEVRIDTLLMLTETASVNEKDELLTRVNHAITQKVFWESRRLPSLQSLADEIDIDFDPHDTPYDLRMKGDLLLDREESLRRELKGIDTRMQSLADEETVRRKVAELTRDLRMFDEREEILGREIPLTDTRRLFSRGAQQSSMDMTQQEKDFVIKDINHILSSPNPRSLASIQRWIEVLTEYREKVVSRADSLHRRALWFHEKAEEKRD
ncbi:MAG TPA: hypothetical protein ENN03_03750 [bacterium]|nr:hypothetical protein [bacterium]